jgi:hypothetical protein
MAHPTKGGRPKNLWDISTTIGALDELIGDEPDPGPSAPERSFLHFVRALCRNLEANMPAILAFDRLFRLMRERAEPIRLYARDVGDAFAGYRPLAPSMDEVLGRGEADELWKFWFFACEMPKRLQGAMANVDRLLYAAEELMPAPFSVPGFQLVAARAGIILGLGTHGYGAADIAKLLDPAGYKQSPRGARDRVRKEMRRLGLPNGQGGGRSGQTKAEIESLLSPGARPPPPPAAPGRAGIASPRSDKPDA